MELPTLGTSMHATYKEIWYASGYF